METIVISTILVNIWDDRITVSIEWLKLRSALITILVSQPLTSNPQPKPLPLFSGHSIFLQRD